MEPGGGGRRRRRRRRPWCARVVSSALVACAIIVSVSVTSVRGLEDGDGATRTSSTTTSSSASSTSSERGGGGEDAVTNDNVTVTKECPQPGDVAHESSYGAAALEFRYAVLGHTTVAEDMCRCYPSFGTKQSMTPIIVDGKDKKVKKEPRPPLISLREYKQDVEEKVAAKRAEAEAKKKKKNQGVENDPVQIEDVADSKAAVPPSSDNASVPAAQDGAGAKSVDLDASIPKPDASKGDKSHHKDVVDKESRAPPTTGAEAEAVDNTQDHQVSDASATSVDGDRNNDGDGSGDSDDAVEVAKETANDEDENMAELVIKSERLKSSDAELYNYAAGFNGAKVVSSNKDSKHASAALKEDKDVYYISPCASEKFVTVELSEEATVTAVVLGNFEFHSSGVKDFEIWGTDGHHSNEEGWKRLLRGRAENVRELQKFTLPSPTWVHYVQIRLIGTGHENQHFCTLSLLRVHGKDAKETLKEEMERMEAEVLEVEQLLSSDKLDDDDDGDDDDDDDNNLEDEDNREDEDKDADNAVRSKHDDVGNVTRGARNESGSVKTSGRQGDEGMHRTGDSRTTAIDDETGASTSSHDVGKTDGSASTNSSATQRTRDDEEKVATPSPSWIQRIVGKGTADKPESENESADMKSVNATLPTDFVIEVKNATAMKNATIAKNTTVGAASNATAVAPAKSKVSGAGSELSKGGGGENVFRLLAQKIKDLELNQSLLSRYVESLNERYGGALEDFGKEIDEIEESVSNSTQELDEATARSLASSKTCDDAVSRVSAHAERLVKSAVNELEAYRNEVAKRDTVLAFALALTAGALVASRRTNGIVERILSSIASVACLVVCVASVLIIARAKLREGVYA
jgi:hypothetical protein